MCNRYLNQALGPRRRTTSIRLSKLNETLMINEVNEQKTASPAIENVTLDFETEFEDLGAVDVRLELARQAEAEQKSLEKEEEKNEDTVNAAERRAFNENPFVLQIAFDLQRLKVDLVDIEPQEAQSTSEDDDVGDESRPEMDEDALRGSKNSLCLEMCRFSASFEWHWARKTLAISNEQVKIYQ